MTRLQVLCIKKIICASLLSWGSYAAACDSYSAIESSQVSSVSGQVTAVRVRTDSATPQFLVFFEKATHTWDAGVGPRTQTIACAYLMVTNQNLKIMFSPVLVGMNAVIKGQSHTWNSFAVSK